MYLTNSEADVFFETRPDSSVWDTISEEKKTQFLTEATRLIDNLNYAGDKADSEQELEFPRGEDTSIPTSIKNACCEIAYALLTGRNVEYDNELVGASVGNEVGRIDLKVINIAKIHGIPSIKAWYLLRPFFRDGSSITLNRIS